MTPHTPDPDEALVERVARAIREAPMRAMGHGYLIDPTVPLTDAEMQRGRAALAAMPSACPAGGSGWIKTTDRLPERLGTAHYEWIKCLIWVRGEIEIALWNCEHLVWDDESGDDFLYRPTEPTHWQPLPAPPAAGERGGRGEADGGGNLRGRSRPGNRALRRPDAPAARLLPRPAR